MEKCELQNSKICLEVLHQHWYSLEYEKQRVWAELAQKKSIFTH